jgi:hypothetical protein
MKRKKGSISLCPFIYAGAAVAGYAALKNLLGLQRDADADFFKWTGPTATGVDVGSAVIDLPIMYYRDDTFVGVFSAGYQAVQAVLWACSARGTKRCRRCCHRKRCTLSS